MQLYGTDLPLDRRRMVGFGRDISLVSEEDFSRIQAPSVVDAFPAGLANPNLEYSGLYEDGWSSEDASLVLDRPNPESQLVVRGRLPSVGVSDFKSRLNVVVNGHPAAEQDLTSGPFQLIVPAPSGTGRTHVELHFSATQRLPGADGRPVGAMLTSIGFISQDPA
jgi:hypothetical protein